MQGIKKMKAKILNIFLFYDFFGVLGLGEGVRVDQRSLP